MLSSKTLRLDIYNVTDDELKEMLEMRKIMKERQEILEKHAYRIYESGGKWYSCLPVKKGRAKQICRATREKLEDAIINYYKTLTTCKTVEDIYEEVRDRKAEEGSIVGSTVTRYNTDYNRFYSVWANREISTITAEELREHIRTQKIEHDLSAKGYSNLEGMTRLIFNYAKYNKHLITFDVEEVIKSVGIGKNAFRKPEAKEDFFDERDYKLLINNLMVGDVTAKELAILLMAATGLRVGELATLKWSDYNAEYRELHIQRTETEQTKIADRTKTAAGTRRVPVPEDATWIFDELKKCTVTDPENNQEGWMFFEADKRKPTNPPHRVRAGYIRKRLYKACEEIDKAKRGCHSLRKTYASILRDDSMPAKFITDVMGHTDLKTTDRFYSKPRQSSTTKAGIIDSVQEFAIFAK